MVLPKTTDQAMNAPFHEPLPMNASAGAGESFLMRLGRMKPETTCQPSETVFDEKSSTNRYALLDLLWFVACVMVLFGHYVHFFYVETSVTASELKHIFLDKNHGLERVLTVINMLGLKRWRPGKYLMLLQYS